MKNYLLFILFSIIIFSCGGNDDDSNTPTNTNGISVKINGVLWQGNFVGNMVDDATEQFVVQALNLNSKETFGFTMDYFTGPGTYPIPKDNFAFVSFSRSDKKIFYNLTGSGIIVNITTVETVTGVKKVHGNFAGSLKSNDGEVIQLTEGKF